MWCRNQSAPVKEAPCLVSLSMSKCLHCQSRLLLDFSAHYVDIFCHFFLIEQMLLWTNENVTLLNEIKSNLDLALQALTTRDTSDEGYRGKRYAEISIVPQVIVENVWVLSPVRMSHAHVRNWWSNNCADNRCKMTKLINALLKFALEKLDCVVWVKSTKTI